MALMEFYSHPDIKLEDHLREVGESARKTIASKVLDEIDGGILSDIAYLVGISHDFGKFTTYFQDYLQSKRGEDGLTHHGLISALFALELVARYIKNKNLERHNVYGVLPLISYFVVKHHHGGLDDIERDLNAKSLMDEFLNIKEQLTDMRGNESHIEDIYTRLFENQKMDSFDFFACVSKYSLKIASPDGLKKVIKTIRKVLYEFKKSDGAIIYFLLTQLLFSTLIDADKKHAGKVEHIQRRAVPKDIVDEYKNRDEFKQKNISRINRIRDEIYEAVIKKIDQVDLNQGVFSITAPTGTGKTLTSLSAALKLRRRIEENFGYKPRIIYSLPFTSIIDQNFKVFDDVLKNTIPDFEENESAYIIKHHYQADIKYRVKGKEKPIEESLVLIETWDSEIVVTTFIQLFYSIIGYKNRLLKKFHNMVNSIIILDEVQNIPVKYWDLVGSILSAMAKYFRCRIILLTATKPLIFEKGECIELVKNHEGYFKQNELNRVCLSVKREDKNLLDFFHLLNESEWDKDSYMFVFNTIRSTLEFYNLIGRNKVVSEETIALEGSDIKTEISRITKNGREYEVYYLSANIMPKIRRERIEIIKKRLEEGGRIIIITTQLIEAGVDIDVDVVYRDFAPLDSIIQVAGRCNRNKRLEMGKGEVHIINLVDENNKNKPFATYIYDPVLLNTVDELFKNRQDINESDFLGLINSYFEKTKDNSYRDTKIMKAIYELYYYEKSDKIDINEKIPVSSFKLIEEQPDVDVFVELDNDAKRIWQEYQDIRAEEDRFKRKKKFLKIKKVFYDYVISIPKKYAAGLINEAQEIAYIPNNEISLYYDLDTGFKRGDAGSGALIF